MNNTILIVEDDQDLVNLLTEILKKKGYEVVGHARDGREGLKKYKELKPDLVTLDIMMSPMDGKVCAEKILEYDQDARIMVVSILEYSELKELEKMGVRNFIKKPIDTKELIYNIDKIISQLDRVAT